MSHPIRVAAVTANGDCEGDHPNVCDGVPSASFDIKMGLIG